ncbi:MAG TPA: hypothetical protein O0X69_02655 [Methanocorpusculum sp.]|nr:hypothetical protein [Methanocorpusculum sp.]
MSLADFLLQQKGVLDDGVNDFPNYREIGMNGNVVNLKVCGWKPFGCLLNLNTCYSNRAFITQYLNHIERVAKKEP